MGIRILIIDSEFEILSANVPGAFRAVESLTSERLTDAKGRTGVAWLDMSVYHNASELSDLMLAWRWRTLSDDGGSVVAIEFTGEKLGDDNDLFAALAPFVSPGSYILVADDNGQVWRWLFDGNETIHQFATLHFS